MALLRCNKAGGGPAITDFYLGTAAQAAGSSYPALFIPVEELGNATKITVTALQNTGSIATNGVAVMLVAADYSESGAVTGSLGDAITIPSLGSAKYVKVQITFGWTSGTSKLIAKASLS